MPDGARLEDLTPGAVLTGLADAPVTVVAARWHGTTAVTLTYRDAAGSVGERLVYRDDEPGLQITTAGSTWSFDGDAGLFRLVSEARRIRLAHLFDPMVAVSLSPIEPLPHQIQAVYGELLPRQPLRFLLADDPGAGKTIMAGLYMKELALRGALARCLVVAPGGLVSQWQDELAEKFGLGFTILTRDQIEASQTQNPFADQNLLIARLDHLSRNDDLQDRLAANGAIVRPCGIDRRHQRRASADVRLVPRRMVRCRRRPKNGRTCPITPMCLGRQLESAQMGRRVNRSLTPLEHARTLWSQGRL